MPTTAQEKTPSETLLVSSDFASVLLSGDSLILGNCTVTAKNALTDADATATIVVSGSKTVTGAVLSVIVHNGAIGDIYEVTFSTGLTGQNKTYEASLNLVLVSDPKSNTILCSRDAAKTRLGVLLTDTSEDALIDTLIRSASAYFRTRCKREFTFGTWTETIRPTVYDCRILQLWHYPVRKVDSVTLRYADTTVLVTYTDPTMWAFTEEGYLWFTGLAEPEGFLPFPDANVVQYRAGYPAIPDDLADAVASLTAIFYRLIGKEGLSAERIGDYSYSRAGANLPLAAVEAIQDPLVNSVLKLYRRPMDLGGFGAL